MSTDIRTTFSSNVRARLVELGITQADLAKRLECSQPFVSELLSSAYNPGIHIVNRVAESLGTTASKLLE